MSVSRKDQFDPRLLEAIQEYEAAWVDGHRPEARAFAAHHPDLAPHLLRELAVREFDWHWRTGKEDIAEVHLNRYPEFRGDDEFLLALLRIELTFLPGTPDGEKLVRRFPHLKADIELMLEAYEEADRDQTAPPGTLSHSPHTTLHPVAPRPARSEPEPAAALAPDTTLAVQDRYKVLRLLTTGGQKHVYEAQQLNPVRRVALKVPRKRADGAGMLLEGRVLAGLDHQRIPPVVNLSGADDPVPILAEKHIAGKSWDEVLKEQRAKVDGAPAADRATLRREYLRENLTYLQDVCDALIFAHTELGVIHRDLKPANVMLSRFNEKLGRFTEVYVVDWGLALYVGSAPEPGPGESERSNIRAPRRTAVRGFSGTPCYAAPEMWAGVGERLSAATDVFLLGALLYELLTDSPPYTASNIIRLEMAGRLGRFPRPEERAPDRTIPAELRQIALRALAAEPKDRYADAAEFARALEDYRRHADAEERRERARARRGAIAGQLRTTAGANGALHGHISPLIEVANEFRQAARSWEPTERNGPLDNDAYRQVLQDERDARLELVDLAERTGDLALAEAQVDQVAALPAPFNADAQPRRQRIHALAARRRRSRLLLRTAALAVLLLGIGLIAAGYAFIEKRNQVASEERLKELEAARADAAEKKLDAETKEKALIVAKADADRAKAAADQKLADERATAEKKLAAERAVAEQKLAAERAVAQQRWLNLAVLADDQAFAQGAAVYYARALAEGDDPAVRVRLSETLQRALVPVAFTSRRLPLGNPVYSRDGRFLLTGDLGQEGVIRAWSTADGSQVRVLPGHPAPAQPAARWTVRKIALDPRDPNRAFSAGLDGAVRLTNFVTGENPRQSARDDKGAQFLALDVTRVPVGGRHLLVTTDSLGRLVVWSADALDRVLTVEKAHEGPADAVAVSPDGSLCASGGRDGRVRLWALDGKPVQDLTDAGGKGAVVNDLAFSADGKYLAVARDARDVEIWNIETKTIHQRLKGVEKAKLGDAEVARVYRVVFAPNGDVLANGLDGTVRRWNPATGAASPVVLRHDPDMGGSAAALGLGVSADGTEIATAGLDLTLRRWDATTGRLVAVLEGNPAAGFLGCTAAGFDPKSGTLITASGGTTAMLRSWDVKTLREAHVYTEGHDFDYDPSVTPTAVAVEPGGKRFVAALARGDVLVYDTASKKLLHKEKRAHVYPKGVPGLVPGFEPAVIAAAWSRDGARFATLGTDNGIKLWDATTYKLIDSWKLDDPDRPRKGPFSVPSAAVAFDPDNTHIVTATADGVLLRWNPETKKPVGRYAGHPSAVYALTFSADGEWLASGGKSDVILWDWKKKELSRRAYLPPLMDGRRFGGWRADGAAQAPLNQEMASSVACLAFSADLGRLAVTQSDGSVTILDTVSCGVLHRGVGHEPAPPLVWGGYCFFTESGELLTCGHDGQVLKWGLSPAAAGVRTRGLEARELVPTPGGELIGVTALEPFSVSRWNKPAPGAWPLGADPADVLSVFKVKDWPLVARIKGDMGPDRPARVAVTPDGKKVVVGNYLGTAAVLDRGTNAVVASFKPAKAWAPGNELPGITTVAVDPTGTVAASNGSVKREFRVDVWQISDGKPIKVLERDGARGVTVAFRPNGTDLATLDEEGTIVVWDWRAGKERYALKGAPATGTGVALAYAPDGSHFVQSGNGGEMFAVDADTGKVRQRWFGHARVATGPFGGVVIAAVAFNKDGLLATCGTDATVRLWKLEDADGKREYREVAVWSVLKLTDYGVIPGGVGAGLLDRPGPDILPTAADLHHALFTTDGEYLLTWGIGTPVHVVHLPTALQALNGPTPADVLRETERVTGLRLDGTSLVPVDRNVLVPPRAKE